MAAVNEKDSRKILQFTIGFSCTPFVSGYYFSSWNHNLRNNLLRHGCFRCFRQYSASLWFETFHPKDTGQYTKSWKSHVQQFTTWMNSSSFPMPFASFFDRITLITLHTQISHRIPCLESLAVLFIMLFPVFLQIKPKGSDKHRRQPHNVLISTKNAPFFE